MRSLRFMVLLLSGAVLSACGGGVTDPLTKLHCDGVPATSLAVGAHTIVDPATSGGCLRLPPAGAGGAEYLVVALSANGQESRAGVQGSFELSASTDNFAPILAPVRLAGAPATNGPAAFDAMLRADGRELTKLQGLQDRDVRYLRERAGDGAVRRRQERDLSG